MTTLTVTARLSSPMLERQRIHLDGPLYWAWVQRELAQGRHVPRITNDFAPDFPIPLERWEIGDAWGWKTSVGVEDVTSWTAIQVRRKPATDAMARYSTAAKHHAGLGPFKARDTTLSGRHVRSITWEIEATDETLLCELLSMVTSLSARYRNGFGRVETWRVEPSRTIDGWRNRMLPQPNGTPTPIRAPYWHRSRMQPCA